MSRFSPPWGDAIRRILGISSGASLSARPRVERPDLRLRERRPVRSHARVRVLRRRPRRGRRLSEFRTQVFRLNAADFGAPQKRIRTIVVGSRVGPSAEPVPTHAKSARPSGLRWRSLRDAFPRGPASPRSRRSARHGFPKPPGLIPGASIEGAFKLRELHVTQNYSLDLADPVCPHRPWTGTISPTARLSSTAGVGIPRGAGDVLGRLRWDEPAVTIRTEFFRAGEGALSSSAVGEWRNSDQSCADPRRGRARPRL